MLMRAHSRLTQRVLILNFYTTMGYYYPVTTSSHDTLFIILHVQLVKYLVFRTFTPTLQLPVQTSFHFWIAVVQFEVK